MAEGARQFGERVKNTFSDPRSKIHIADAKTFFANHKKTYDLIISEPSNPWVSGVSSLFTREFYQRVKNHMKQDAVFVQWLQLYEINIDLVATVFNALSMEFSDYLVYASNNGADMIIVAKKEGLVSEAQLPTDTNSLIRTSLSDHGINTDDDLQLHLVSSKQILAPAFSTVSDLVNSDYFPHLENGAARARYAQSNSNQLFNTLMYQVPVLRAIQSDMNVDSGSYTHTKAYRLSANMHSAHIMYKTLIGEDIVDENMDGRKQMRSTFLTLFQHQLKNCPATEPEQTIGMLHQLANYVLPYLSQNELASLWRKVETSNCIQNTAPDGELRQWLALHQAISAREFEATQRLSEQILATTKNASKDLSAFLVTAALLGNYHSENDNRAEILNKWGDVLTDGSPETLFATAVLASHRENRVVGSAALADSH